ncbi:MAG TPA: hypothetical protein VFG00_00670, partial [Acidothermaceae bacterium]|nr:hypothetical protein [Acidothermaceae bacterium]
DGDDGEVITPSATDWGVSLGEPSGGLPIDVPRMDEDGTGPAIDVMAATDESEAAEPVAQLASTGGRWRSRSAG